MDTREVAQVKSIVVDNWDGAFYVEDKSGEICVYVEVENPGVTVTNLRGLVPIKLGKKYTLVYTVPIGYIDVFLRDKA